MSKSTIQQLADFGQSVWLDNINRTMLENGELKELISKGLRGMTSNPSIFNNAISKSSSYDAKIKELAAQGKSTFEIYDELTVADIQEAADNFKDVYQTTKGLDGYVSLEVNPKLADDTVATIEEAKRLWDKVNRPNLMLKVPATDAGFEAIEELLKLGMNVNITLIFSLDQYVKTVQAFLKGLTERFESGADIHNVASVASVFISRIDSVVDKRLDELQSKGEDVASLKGKAAVANTQIIFKKYLELFSSQGFQSLHVEGAKIQRALWGSTSTKNPEYSDVKYVAELIGKDTVNTIPDNTLKAFLDHGKVKESLTSDADQAQQVIENLDKLGIDINQVCNKLLQDGVVAFEEAFESLLKSIEEKAKSL